MFVFMYFYLFSFFFLFTDGHFDLLAYLLIQNYLADLPVFVLIPNWQPIQLVRAVPGIAFVGIVD